MKVAQQRVVAIHYTLTDERGQQLDSSEGKEPLVYLHGAQGLIPGLEKQLEGREPGDRFAATVPPEEAYGEVNPELIQEVPLEVLEGIDNLQVGMALQAKSPEGHVQNLRVDAIGDDTATLNANHPLAGEVLHFEVSVEDVRDATPEEREHGHVH
jgi:FKBP-type peptidyl-prolyl cis-trans isomerase SlyD